MIRPNPGNTDFDHFSTDYDAALADGLSVSGESKEYFAEGRIEWLRECLRKLAEHPHRIMDFGCGTGTAVPFICGKMEPGLVVGIDVSAKSLQIARQRCGPERTAFFQAHEYVPNAEMDLVFCNGVFHHIPIDGRSIKLQYIFESLRAGGLFAFWENNPWNPGTRYVMSRIPFDRDAKTLSAPAAKRMLEASGFEILLTDFLFVFPRFLSWFRNVEGFLSKIPFGAQYQILCRKPLGEV